MRTGLFRRSPYCYSDYCDGFVNDASSNAGHHQWELSAYDCNGWYGHVVICNGDGTASTSGWTNFGGLTHASISWLESMECGRAPAGYAIPQ